MTDQMPNPEPQISQSDAFVQSWDEPQKSALSQGELDQLTDDLIEALKTVYDPEIPVDIYELGLIYKVDVNDDRDVVVEMTLTAPGVPRRRRDARLGRGRGDEGSRPSSRRAPT